MEKIWLVLKNEINAIVRRRSFIVTLILIPLVSLIVMLVMSVSRNDPSNAIFQVFAGGEDQPEIEGFVDQAGLIKSLPPWVSAGRLIRFQQEADAMKALNEKRINAFYVLPPDYMQTGHILYTRADFNPVAGASQSSEFRDTVRFNLLGGDVALTERLRDPVRTDVTYLSQEPQRSSDSALTFFLPYIVAMLFYVILMSTSSLMLNSVNTEKQNRVIEILMVSVTPMQMFTGKLIGLGIVGLGQTLFWSMCGLAILRLSGQTMGVSAAFQLPVSILAWGAVFFLLGYAVYGAMMAGIGAMAPNLREASQATTLVIIPLVLPVMMIGAISTDPSSTLALALSLFPLTAPVTMMTRLAAGSVPFWQPPLAAVLLAGAAYLVVRAVAGIFRSQVLLSGQAFNAKLFLRALLGRA